MVSGEKRNNEEVQLMEKITTVLLDVEGTTTSVSFVKDKLFPYAKEHLETYVNSHWDEPEFKDDVLALKSQAKEDEEAKLDGFCPIEDGENEKPTLIKNVLWQMSKDRKTTALKQLQGHIWRDGYKSGALKGHIYSDIAPVFKKWCEENKKICIFSSGSVEAQKLLFGHSEEGDLLKYISGHFDTTVGAKTESSSYANIIKSLECEKDQILFLTDVVKEAEAAKEAGMKVAIVVREGNEPLTDAEKEEFVILTSLNDLAMEASAKRKKLSDGEEDLAEKKSEKEEVPTEENSKSHVNGGEAMEVDAPEAESQEEKKSQAVESKTEEEKTESEEVEIDVVSEEEKKDEGSSAENGVETDPMQTENSKETEPQIDVAENEAQEAVDPLDITEEKDSKTENQENVESTTADKSPEKEPEAKEENNTNSEAEAVAETVDSNDAKPVTDGNVTSGEEVNGESEKNGDKEEITTTSNPKKIITEEVNGKSAEPEEADKNGIEPEDITVNKIVPEDKPEPTVEVNA